MNAIHKKAQMFTLFMGSVHVLKLYDTSMQLNKKQKYLLIKASIHKASSHMNPLDTDM